VGTVYVDLGARVSNLERLCRFFGVFLVRLKRSEKGAQSPPKRSLFRGGRHGASVVNSSKNLVFVFLSRHPFWTTFGTVLGSILGAFWEPKSTLYSVLVDLGCKLGAQKQWGGRGCVLWCPGCQNGPFWVVPASEGNGT